MVKAMNLPISKTVPPIRRFALLFATTRREYIPIGSVSASMPTTVAANSKANRLVAVDRFSIFCALFFIFLILIISSANAANNLAPRATVDRTVVTTGDSLTLTIRIDDTGSYDEPDYSLLQKDFDVYGSSQSSQHVINNGRIESWTEWQTTLTPKHSGQLQIPPLAVAGSRTQPITIQVNADNNTGNSAVDGSEPVFIEVQTDRNSVYVQQQVLLTARVYIAVQLDNMQLTKPDFDNANIKQIGESTFNRTVNGTPYEVHELTYAIFPQQPGELTIPELVFNAVEITSRRSLFDFPGRGRAVRKMSKQLSVHIKPIPKNFSGPVWLPARNLTLTESWSGDPHHLAAGDSITRNIAIRADGLLAAQLPKLEQPQLDSAKLYADQPTLDDQQDGNGVHSKRVENTALIPTHAGQLQLPETRVAWWDIDSDSEKIASLPSESFAIAAGANNTAAPAPTPAQPAPIQQPTANNSTPTTPTNLTPVSSGTLLWWQIATAVFALLWIIASLAYWQQRKKTQASPRISASVTAISAQEEKAWSEFSAACRANNPVSARQTLLNWAVIFYRDDNVHSIEQLQRHASDQSLTRELQLLDNRLFGALRDSGEWNGETLLRVVRDLKNRKSKKQDSHDTALSPLYPAT